MIEVRSYNVYCPPLEVLHWRSLISSLVDCEKDGRALIVEDLEYICRLSVCLPQRKGKREALGLCSCSLRYGCCDPFCLSRLTKLLTPASYQNIHLHIL